MRTLKDTVYVLVDATVSSASRRDDIKGCVHLYDEIIAMAAKELNSIAVSDDAMMRTRVLAAANILSNIATADFNQLVELLGQYKKQIEFFQSKL